MILGVIQSSQMEIRPLHEICFVKDNSYQMLFLRLSPDAANSKGVKYFVKQPSLVYFAKLNLHLFLSYIDVFTVVVLCSKKIGNYFHFPC